MLLITTIQSKFCQHFPTWRETPFRCIYQGIVFPRHKNQLPVGQVGVTACKTMLSKACCQSVFHRKFFLPFRLQLESPMRSLLVHRWRRPSGRFSKLCFRALSLLVLSLFGCAWIGGEEYKNGKANIKHRHSSASRFLQRNGLCCRVFAHGLWSPEPVPRVRVSSACTNCV